MTENKEIKKKVFDELNDICSECKKEIKTPCIPKIGTRCINCAFCMSFCDFL